MEAGRLNNRVKLISPADPLDQGIYGQVLGGGMVEKEVFAEVKEKGGTATITIRRPFTIGTVELEIDDTWKVMWRGTQYDIESVSDPDGLGVVFEISCKPLSCEPEPSV